LQVDKQKATGHCDCLNCVASR